MKRLKAIDGRILATCAPAILLFNVGVSFFLGMGCEPVPLSDGLPGEVTCSSCHGSGDSPAPPVAADGSSDPGEIGVGAHQAHLLNSDIRAAIQCSECHIVPENVDDEGHVDALPAELTWGELASADGAKPSWDHGTATCSGTYCHGATLSGGSDTEPDWTRVDGSQASCGSCHGAPPPSPHPASDQCQSCHDKTLSADGTIDVAGGYHMNGQLEASSLECNACHGNEVNAAPPVSLGGSSDTADPAVGAHQSHLLDSEIRKAIPCEECHVVPANVDDEDHLGESPAELTWGVLATSGGLTPEWDGDNNRCANTYCHGGGLSGGVDTEPLWTVVDGSQAACGSCHGAPPPSPHPAETDCSQCHPGTANAAGQIDVEGGLHINGVVDLGDIPCNYCHGNDVNAAPPVSVSGSSDTNDTEVGAHQSHVQDSGVRKAVLCEECHVVPENVGDEGHLGESPAELVWGPLATTGGLSPTWDRGADTCSNTYCHGASLDGGARIEPVWTQVDGTQTTCGSCHGYPPPPPHSTYTDCKLCHPGTVNAAGQIDVDGGKHIDGTVEVVDMACNSCHGNEDNAAPPLSVDGSSDTTLVEVGAHQSHVTDGPYRSAISCEECHIVPASVGASGHLDAAPAEVVWGALATTDGADPEWDSEQARCTNTYCHGATIGGNSTDPDWTKVGENEARCGTCHGVPPPSPHPDAYECSSCHPKTITPDFEIDIESGYHINGTIDVEMQN